MWFERRIGKIEGDVLKIVMRIRKTVLIILAVVVRDYCVMTRSLVMFVVLLTRSCSGDALFAFPSSVVALECGLFFLR